MSKTVVSPVKHFPGTVFLADPMNMNQVLTWERTYREAKALPKGASLSEYNAAYLPALLVCVERWSIKGVPENPAAETFPFSPRLASAELVGWLIGEVSQVYLGEAEESKND